MKQGKFFNIKNTLLPALICGLFAAPSFTHAADTSAMQALIKNGVSPEMAGKSIASLSTMGEAQNFAFLRGISHRQNSIHSIAKNIGRSEVFFGDGGSSGGDDTVKDVIDGFAKQFGFDGLGDGPAPEFWSLDFTRRGKVNAAESRNTYEFDLNGFAGGLDMKLGKNWMVGIAGGYSRTSSSFESLYDTSTAVDAYHTALYATYEKASITLDSVTSFTYLANDSQRGLNETREVAQAKARGYQLAWMVSAMKQHEMNGYMVTPMTGFTYTSQVNHGMHEEGAAYNLSTAADVRHSLKPMLGVDVARAYQLDKHVTLTPEVYGIYRYEVLDNEEDVTARMDSYSLSTPSTRLSRHSMQIGMAVSLKIADRFTSKLSLDSDMQPEGQEHRAMFKLNYTW